MLEGYFVWVRGLAFFFSKRVGARGGGGEGARGATLENKTTQN